MWAITNALAFVCLFLLLLVMVVVVEGGGGGGGDKLVIFTVQGTPPTLLSARIGKNYKGK